MPAAATSIVTWPPSGRSGAGRSCTWSTSGGPCLVITTACIRGRAYPNEARVTDARPRVPPERPTAVAAAASPSERHGAAVHEAVAGDDLVHHVLWHGPVARDGHRGQRPVVLRRAVGLAAHGRRDDVDAVLAEGGPDAADHARHVGVAEEGDVGLELQVEPVAPGLEQMRARAAADRRAHHPNAVLAAGHDHTDEVGVVARRGALGLDQL